MDNSIVVGVIITKDNNETTDTNLDLNPFLGNKSILLLYSYEIFKIVIIDKDIRHIIIIDSSCATSHNLKNMNNAGS